MISRAPIEIDDDDKGWLHLFSYPVLSPEDLVERAGKESETVPWSEMIMQAREAGSSLEHYTPDFQLARASPTVAGWTLYMSQLPSGRELRKSEDILDLTVAENGCLELQCGRAGDRIGTDLFVVLEAIVAGLAVKFFAFAGALYDRAQYAGQVDVGLAVTGIKGAEPYSTVKNIPSRRFPKEFQQNRYTRTTQVDAPALASGPMDIAHQLLKPFFRGLTHGQYNPLEDTKS